jgi:hypothetical protein
MHAPATSARSSVGPPSHRTERTPRSRARWASTAAGVAPPAGSGGPSTSAAHPRPAAVGLGVDLDPRPGSAKSGTSTGTSPRARDRRHDRLGVEAARDAPLALVVVEQLRVALGAQRARARRGSRRPPCASSRSSARSAGWPSPTERPATVARPSAEAIIAAATRGRAVDAAVGQPEAGDDRLRRARRRPAPRCSRRRGHPAQYAEPLSGS